MKADVQLAIDLIVLTVVGGVVSVMGIAKNVWKLILVLFFAVSGAFAVYLVFAQKSQEQSAKQDAINQERSYQAAVQKKLDTALIENGQLRMTLSELTVTNARRQDVLPIFKILAELGQPNAKIYDAAMILQEQLRECSNQYREELTSWREDQHQRWIAAIISGNKIKAERVKKNLT